MASRTFDTVPREISAFKESTIPAWNLIYGDKAKVIQKTEKAAYCDSIGTWKEKSSEATRSEEGPRYRRCNNIQVVSKLIFSGAYVAFSA
jgi:hypothetical protein